VPRFLVFTGLPIGNYQARRIDAVLDQCVEQAADKTGMGDHAFFGRIEHRGIRFHQHRTFSGQFHLQRSKRAIRQFAIGLKGRFGAIYRSAGQIDIIGIYLHRDLHFISITEIIASKQKAVKGDRNPRPP
ncbi:uncharacterized protein METZ01_LOCUS499812, partial [marine metagenome]